MASSVAAAHARAWAASLAANSTTRAGEQIVIWFPLAPPRPGMYSGWRRTMASLSEDSPLRTLQSSSA